MYSHLIFFFFFFFFERVFPLISTEGSTSQSWHRAWTSALFRG
jgi:hypothetical protein